MRFALILPLIVLPHLAQAACIGAELGIQASERGMFDHAAGLATDTDIDQIAALEQQGWREFRYEVQFPICVSLDVETTAEAEDWPTDVRLPSQTARASLYTSADGENFQQLSADTVVETGHQISLLIAQSSGTSGALQHFFPAQWQFAVHVRAADTHSEIAPLIAIQGDRLGCDSLGCGELAASTKPISVSDTPDLTVETPQIASPPADASLATELQTELARVGCYTSTIDGLWGPASRQAMRNFNHWGGKTTEVATPTPKALVAVARATAPVCGVD